MQNQENKIMDNLIKLPRTKHLFSSLYWTTTLFVAIFIYSCCSPPPPHPTWVPYCAGKEYVGQSKPCRMGSPHLPPPMPPFCLIKNNTQRESIGRFCLPLFLSFTFRCHPILYNITTVLYVMLTFSRKIFSLIHRIMEVCWAQIALFKLANSN
jgi:hypothetical protein